eukprot:g976.t1
MGRGFQDELDGFQELQHEYERVRKRMQLLQRQQKQRQLVRGFMCGPGASGPSLAPNIDPIFEECRRKRMSLGLETGGEKSASAGAGPAGAAGRQQSIEKRILRATASEFAAERNAVVRETAQSVQEMFYRVHHDPRSSTTLQEASRAYAEEVVNRWPVWYEDVQRMRDGIFHEGDRLSTLKWNAEHCREVMEVQQGLADFKQKVQKEVYATNVADLDEVLMDEDEDDESCGGSGGEERDAVEQDVVMKTSAPCAPGGVDEKCSPRTKSEGKLAADYFAAFTREPNVATAAKNKTSVGKKEARQLRTRLQNMWHRLRELEKPLPTSTAAAAGGGGAAASAGPGEEPTLKTTQNDENKHVFRTPDLGPRELTGNNVEALFSARTADSEGSQDLLSIAHDYQRSRNASEVPAGSSARPSPRENAGFDTDLKHALASTSSGRFGLVPLAEGQQDDEDDFSAQGTTQDLAAHATATSGPPESILVGSKLQHSHQQLRIGHPASRVGAISIHDSVSVDESKDGRGDGSVSSRANISSIAAEESVAPNLHQGGGGERHQRSVMFGGMGRRGGHDRDEDDSQDDDDVDEDDILGASSASQEEDINVVLGRRDEPLYDTVNKKVLAASSPQQTDSATEYNAPPKSELDRSEGTIRQRNMMTARDSTATITEMSDVSHHHLQGSRLVQEGASASVSGRSVAAATTRQQPQELPAAQGAQQEQHASTSSSSQQNQSQQNQTTATYTSSSTAGTTGSRHGSSHQLRRIAAPQTSYNNNPNSATVLQPTRARAGEYSVANQLRKQVNADLSVKLFCFAFLAELVEDQLQHVDDLRDYLGRDVFAAGLRETRSGNVKTWDLDFIFRFLLDIQEHTEETIEEFFEADNLAVEHIHAALFLVPDDTNPQFQKVMREHCQFLEARRGRGILEESSPFPVSAANPSSNDYCLKVKLLETHFTVEAAGRDWTKVPLPSKEEVEAQTLAELSVDESLLPASAGEVGHQPGRGGAPPARVVVASSSPTANPQGPLAAAGGEVGGASPMNAQWQQMDLYKQHMMMQQFQMMQLQMQQLQQNGATPQQLQEMQMQFVQMQNQMEMQNQMGMGGMQQAAGMGMQWMPIAGGQQFNNWGGMQPWNPNAMQQQMMYNNRNGPYAYGGVGGGNSNSWQWHHNYNPYAYGNNNSVGGKKSFSTAMGENMPAPDQGGGASAKLMTCACPSANTENAVGGDKDNLATTGKFEFSPFLLNTDAEKFLDEWQESVNLLCAPGAPFCNDPTCGGRVTVLENFLQQSEEKLAAIIRGVEVDLDASDLDVLFEIVVIEGSLSVAEHDARRIRDPPAAASTSSEIGKSSVLDIEKDSDSLLPLLWRTKMLPGIVIDSVEAYGIRNADSAAAGGGKSNKPTSQTAPKKKDQKERVLFRKFADLFELKPIRDIRLGVLSVEGGGSAAAAEEPPLPDFTVAKAFHDEVKRLRRDQLSENAMEDEQAASIDRERQGATISSVTTRKKAIHESDAAFEVVIFKESDRPVTRHNRHPDALFEGSRSLFIATVSEHAALLNYFDHDDRSTVESGGFPGRVCSTFTSRDGADFSFFETVPKTEWWFSVEKSAAFATSVAQPYWRGGPFASWLQQCREDATQPPRITICDLLDCVRRWCREDLEEMRKMKTSQGNGRTLEQSRLKSAWAAFFRCESVLKSEGVHALLKDAGPLRKARRLQQETNSIELGTPRGSADLPSSSSSSREHQEQQNSTDQEEQGELLEDALLISRLDKFEKEIGCFLDAQAELAAADMVHRETLRGAYDQSHRWELMWELPEKDEDFGGAEDIEESQAQEDGGEKVGSMHDVEVEGVCFQVPDIELGKDLTIRDLSQVIKFHDAAKTRAAPYSLRASDYVRVSSLADADAKTPPPFGEATLIIYVPPEAEGSGGGLFGNRRAGEGSSEIDDDSEYDFDDDVESDLDSMNFSRSGYDSDVSWGRHHEDERENMRHLQDKGFFPPGHGGYWFD